MEVVEGNLQPVPIKQLAYCMDEPPTASCLQLPSLEGKKGSRANVIISGAITFMGPH